MDLTSGANAGPSFQAIESGLDGNLLKTNTRAQSEPEDDMDVDHPDALDQDRPSPPPEVTSHQDTHPTSRITFVPSSPPRERISSSRRPTATHESSSDEAEWFWSPLPSYEDLSVERTHSVTAMSHPGDNRFAPYNPCYSSPRFRKNHQVDGDYQLIPRSLEINSSWCMGLALTEHSVRDLDSFLLPRDRRTKDLAMVARLNGDVDAQIHRENWMKCYHERLSRVRLYEGIDTLASSSTPEHDLLSFLVQPPWEASIVDALMKGRASGPLPGVVAAFFVPWRPSRVFLLVHKAQAINQNSQAVTICSSVQSLARVSGYVSLVHKDEWRELLTCPLIESVSAPIPIGDGEWVRITNGPSTDDYGYVTSTIKYPFHPPWALRANLPRTPYNVSLVCTTPRICKECRNNDYCGACITAKPRAALQGGRLLMTWLPTSMLEMTPTLPKRQRSLFQNGLPAMVEGDELARIVIPPTPSNLLMVGEIVHVHAVDPDPVIHSHDTGRGFRVAQILGSADEAQYLLFASDPLDQIHARRPPTDHTVQEFQTIKVETFLVKHRDVSRRIDIGEHVILNPPVYDCNQGQVVALDRFKRLVSVECGQSVATFPSTNFLARLDTSDRDPGDWISWAASGRISVWHRDRYADPEPCAPTARRQHHHWPGIIVKTQRSPWVKGAASHRSLALQLGTIISVVPGAYHFHQVPDAFPSNVKVLVRLDPRGGMSMHLDESFDLSELLTEGPNGDAVYLDEIYHLPSSIPFVCKNVLAPRPRSAHPFHPPSTRRDSRSPTPPHTGAVETSFALAGPSGPLALASQGEEAMEWSDGRGFLIPQEMDETEIPAAGLEFLRSPKLLHVPIIASVNGKPHSGVLTSTNDRIRFKHSFRNGDVLTPLSELDVTRITSTAFSKTKKALLIVDPLSRLFGQLCVRIARRDAHHIYVVLVERVNERLMTKPWEYYYARIDQLIVSASPDPSHTRLDYARNLFVEDRKHMPLNPQSL